MAALMDDLLNSRISPTVAREVTKAGTVLLNTAALQEKYGLSNITAGQDRPQRRGFRLIG